MLLAATPTRLPLKKMQALRQSTRLISRAVPIRHAVSSRKTLAVVASGRDARVFASSAAVAEAPAAEKAANSVDFDVPSPTPAEMDVERGFRLEPSVDWWCVQHAVWS